MAAQRSAAPPDGLDWPTETYAHAHRTRGEDIVAFLSRVWLPLIEAEHCQNGLFGLLNS